jgi:type VI secretion system protein ImpA
MVELLSLPDPAEDPPAGPNLEHDPMFGEMERAAQGKPESQFGNTVEPAVPPNWAEAAALAEKLLARTRDLRAMVILATGQLHTQGLPAYAALVSLIRHHLETMWEQVHPLLDPEDDNDPTQRASIVGQLGQPGQILRPLRELPLASLPRRRPVTLRDIAILNGSMAAEPGREKLTEAAIRDTFANTDAAAFASLRSAVDGLSPDIAAIAAIFPDMPTPARSNLDGLAKLVRDIQTELERYEALVVEAPDAEPDEDEPGTAPSDGPAHAPRAGRSITSIQSIAAINSRDDALHALDLAATYFRNNEPSSPLPLLIDRAKRLAPLPFLDILRDLAPDGLLQAQTIAGTTEQTTEPQS